MDLARYGEEAEKFLASFTEEFYRHDAGLKEELEISGIFQQHQALFAPGVVSRLMGERGTREGRYLAEFAVMGRVEHGLRGITEEIHTEEARATVEWEGREIPWRQASIVVANEEEAGRRHALERLTVAATAALNPQRARRLSRAQELAKELGFAECATMCAEVGGVDLEGLRKQTARVLGETRERYERAMEEALASAGLPRGEATTGDWSFVRRGHDSDEMFPPEQVVPALKWTMAGLGIEMDGQANLTLDLEDRPLKSPRAFCAAVRVPEDVRLVIRPHGGHDDYAAILHEAGHAEHFAHTKAEAPFAFRYLGDNSVTEAYAFLFDGLTQNAEWLGEALGRRETRGHLALARLTRLHLVRRYAAKLAYELDLHRAGGAEGMAERYARSLGEAVGLHVWAEDFLFDMDDFFYCARYLRAWMLEVQMRRRMVERFGRRWFATTAAGDYLRELWGLGQELEAEEVAARLGCEGLEVEGLIEELTAAPE